MIDVGIITPRYPPVTKGGGEQSVRLLATQLQSSDRVERVIVFSFDGTGTTTQDDVEVHRLGSISPFVTEYQNLAAYPKLRSRLEEFDIIHAYNMELHPVAGYLTDTADVPSVATLNSYHYFPSSVTNTTATGLEWLYDRIGYPTTGRLLRHYMKRIDTFLALSESLRDIYHENGFAGQRIEHVPNMIDPGFDVPVIDSAEHSLLYVGSLDENKGVRYLVEAMALLPQTYRLRIVGDGNRTDSLRALARDLDVLDRIEFSGRVPYEEIGQVYADAELFVHPGVWPEPHGRTILEAMQAGLPVVCTDVGGPPEIIPDTELCCEPANPDALANAIERARLLERERDIGATNQRYVHERYAPAAIVSRIVGLYEDLLNA